MYDQANVAAQGYTAGMHARQLYWDCLRRRARGRRRAAAPRDMLVRKKQRLSPRAFVRELQPRRRLQSRRPRRVTGVRCRQRVPRKKLPQASGLVPSPSS
jgi:hypothetical protein